MQKIEAERRHLCFKHPFTCMLAGPTSSGKTVLIRNILKHYDKTIYFKVNIPVPLKVLWCFGQSQGLHNEKLDNCDVTYVDGLPSEEEVDTIKPHIIIIDDLMTELSNNKSLTDLFTKGSHHKNMSVVFISQNVFHQGSQMRTISLNCHYMLLMKNPRDKLQIQTLSNQLNPTKPKFIVDAYNEATKHEFGYIRLDLKQDTPEKYRVQTRIIPENGEISVIAFIPK